MEISVIVAKLPEKETHITVERDATPAALAVRDGHSSIVIQNVPSVPAVRPQSAFAVSQPATFNEQRVLMELFKRWELLVNKHWPENRDLTPVIRKVVKFAEYLQDMQRQRAKRLQEKVEQALQ